MERMVEVTHKVSFERFKILVQQDGHNQKESAEALDELGIDSVNSTEEMQNLFIKHKLIQDKEPKKASPKLSDIMKQSEVEGFSAVATLLFCTALGVQTQIDYLDENLGMIYYQLNGRLNVLSVDKRVWGSNGDSTKSRVL